MKYLYLFLFCVIKIIASEKQTLYIGGLLELSNSWYAPYANFLTSIIEYVFEEVENRTDILTDYSLQLVAKDTEGKSGLATRRMVELMTDGTPKVAVLGPTLSAQLTVVGQVTPFYNVLQMSYIASTSSVVDRDLFQTLYTVNQIQNDLNPLRIKMMEYFNWNRVGTIFKQDDINVSVMTLFHELLSQNNLSLVTSVVVSDGADLKELITRLAHYDVRIIMGSFRSNLAPAIFCEAYKQGLYGHNHVWILAGTMIYPNWLYKANLDGLGCTREQLVEATHGYFSLNYVRLSVQNDKAISNKTPTEVESILREQLARTNYKFSSSFGWVYDCAWALAIGLNNTLKHLNDSGFANYTNNPYYLDAVLRGMSEVNFSGISGPVVFDSEQGRIGLTYIEQNFNSTQTTVAVYNPLNDNLTWFVPVQTLWEGGNIPEDRFTYHRLMVQPNIPSLVLIMLANIFCCLVALGFLGFNIYYRTKSNIKLSSPMINNLIIVGSLLMYVGVFSSAFDYGNLLCTRFKPSICMLRVWILSLGFTTLFGALFSKTWRVHILFRDYKLRKTSIKDYHLFGLVFFLLLIDCILLIAWSCTHGLQKKSVFTNTQDVYNYNNVISEVYTYCYHPYEGYWFLCLYIYKGLLLIFGTFLAWETRHVTVPALNDSKYIGFCIYNVVIVCVFGVPLAHVLPTEQMTLNFVLLSALVMFCTTMCLCILFIPKLKFRNQVSERFFIPSLNTLSQASVSDSGNKLAQQKNVIQVAKSNDKESSDDCQSVLELKSENNRLRMQIATDTIALARLKRDILHVTGNVQFYRVGNKFVVFQSKHVRKEPKNNDVILAQDQVNDIEYLA